MTEQKTVAGNDPAHSRESLLARDFSPRAAGENPPYPDDPPCRNPRPDWAKSHRRSAQSPKKVTDPLKTASAPPQLKRTVAKYGLRLKRPNPDQRLQHRKHVWVAPLPTDVSAGHRRHQNVEAGQLTSMLRGTMSRRKSAYAPFRDYSGDIAKLGFVPTCPGSASTEADFHVSANRPTANASNQRNRP